MKEKIRVIMWLLFNVVAIANGFLNKVLQQQDYTVEENSKISSDNVIANVFVRSKRHCAGAWPIRIVVPPFTTNPQLLADYRHAVLQLRLLLCIRMC